MVSVTTNQLFYNIDIILSYFSYSIPFQFHDVRVIWLCACVHDAHTSCAHLALSPFTFFFISVAPMRHWWAYIHVTNRFHVAVRLFSKKSQKTSKCVKSRKVANDLLDQCGTDVLITFWRLLWSFTEQTHCNYGVLHHQPLRSPPFNSEKKRLNHSGQSNREIETHPPTHPS